MSERAVLVIGVGLVLALTLATGPVGLIEITDREGAQNLGSGTVSATVLDEPDRITLEPTDDGQRLYTVSVPEIRVELSEVSGNPLLSYALSLDEIGFGTESVQLLEGASHQTVTMELSTDPLQQHEVEQLTEAGLTLRVRADSDRVLFEKTVPVEVIE